MLLTTATFPKTRTTMSRYSKLSHRYAPSANSSHFVRGIGTLGADDTIRVNDGVMRASSAAESRRRHASIHSAENSRSCASSLCISNKPTEHGSLPDGWSLLPHLAFWTVVAMPPASPRMTLAANAGVNQWTSIGPTTRGPSREISTLVVHVAADWARKRRATKRAASGATPS